MNIENRKESTQKSLRKKVHIGVSLLLIVVIVLFKYVLEDNVISSLLQVASYTYGPLLGLFAFGIITKHGIKDNQVWIVAIVSVVLTYILNSYSAQWLNGYIFGYELLIINGLITFFGLLLIRQKSIQ